MATAEKNDAISAGTSARIRPSKSASMPRPVVKDMDLDGGLEVGLDNGPGFGHDLGALRGTRIRLRGSIASKPV